MALTLNELAVVRSYVGSEPPIDDLQETHERLGSVQGVVEEVLRRRLADLQAKPAQFSVAGEYSQSTAENIRSLKEMLDRVGAELGPGGTSLARIIPPPPRRIR